MKNSFQPVYAVQEVGLRAVRPGLFTWCSSAPKRLEAAREAETGGVLFASMSVVMNGHVFVENGLRGAVQWGNKDAGQLADGQTVKNCAIQKHRCCACYTRSLWGFQKVHFLRIYMATTRLSFGSCVSHDSRYLISWLNQRRTCSYGIPCLLKTGSQNTRTGIWRPCGAASTCRCRQVALGETVPLCWKTLTFGACSLTSPGVVPFTYLPNPQLL